jgi:hypothetical protein
MSTVLAMEAKVYSPKLTLPGSLSKLLWSKKVSPLLPLASKPTLALAISRFHGPSEVFNFDHLSQKCCCGIPATIFKQIRTWGHEPACDSEQYRHGDRLVTTVPEWRDTMKAIGATDVTENL